MLTMINCYSRKNPFYLLVALDDTLSAYGQLFLDDGESTGEKFMI